MKSTQNKGFTLIELLVAMAITSIIMAAVVSTYQIQVRGQNTQAALTDMNDSARAALAIMTNEIRTAGMDPLQTAGAGIVSASSTSLNFTRDIGNGINLQPDGDTGDANENITYQLYTDSDGNQDLGRNTGSGLQPLIYNVDALNFVYLDGSDPPKVLPAPINLTAIRHIQVTIVTRAGSTSGGFLFPYKDSTTYTNLQGDTVFTAPGDSFRRLALSTTINCLDLGTVNIQP